MLQMGLMKEQKWSVFWVRKKKDRPSLRKKKQKVFAEKIKEGQKH